MNTQDFAGVVPAQYTGKEIKAEASLTFQDDAAASAFYEVAKSRLLHVNSWDQIAGMMSAVFQLVDAKGNVVTRPVQQGDYFKIDIPGPGSKAGDGYDWVKVELLNEMYNGSIQSIGLRVRPTQNPFNENTGIAHFYAEEATSSFFVAREGLKVSAVIIDRNIKPNKDTDLLTDKIRDVVVGISAMSAFSKVQWQKFADGLVAEEKPNR